MHPSVSGMAVVDRPAKPTPSGRPEFLRQFPAQEEPPLNPFLPRGCRPLPRIPSVASRRVSGEGCVFSLNDLSAAPVPTSLVLVLPLCGIIQNGIGNVYFRVCPRLQTTPRPFSPPVPSRAIPCRAPLIVLWQLKTVQVPAVKNARRTLWAARLLSARDV